MTKAAELAKMGEVLSNSQIGRKNIIINGAMQISQRSTSETSLGGSSGIYPTLDRMKIGVGNTDGRFTMSQSAVTDLEGFSNALKIDCTTADTSVATNSFLIMGTNIEGFDLQQLKATSTTTRAFTLSFYAKSNASRAIVTEINFSNGTNKSASKLHTIGTSWARYTFTVASASSTQIDNDNSHELSVNFWFNAGSTYTSGTMSNTLQPITNANRAVGIGDIFASTDNEIEITGIQLEVGSQATPFEHRSFGEELKFCERYFQKHLGTADSNIYTTYAAHRWSNNIAFMSFPLRGIMRAEPSLAFKDKNGTALANSSGVGLVSGDGNHDNFTAGNVAFTSGHDGVAVFTINLDYNPDNNHAHNAYIDNLTRMDFDAEL